MSSSRSLNRKAEPTPSRESSPLLEGAASPRRAQKTSAGRKRSGASAVANSSARSEDVDRRVDPHLSRLGDNGVDASTAVVDRTRFTHAPDPVDDPESARAFAAVLANRAPQPSRRPLACVDTSKVRPEIMSAIDRWVYHGLCKQEACIPDYINYSGHPSTTTSATISKQIKVHAWEWYKEENVVAPWKALSSEARHVLVSMSLSKDNLPVLSYTDDDPAQDPPTLVRSQVDRTAGATLANLTTKLNKGVTVEDFVRARADTSNGLCTLRIRTGDRIEEAFVSVEAMVRNTELTKTKLHARINLSARSSSVAWVLANSFSTLEGGGLCGELPTHEVRYNKTDIDKNRNLRADAPHAIPIDWTPRRLFEQYWFYKRIGCLHGRDMVADGFYVAAPRRSLLAKK